MKKWIALLLALCLLIPCAVLGETATETAGEAAAESEAAEPDLHSIRYYFEHRLLPQLLYDDPEVLINFLAENGTFTLWTNFTVNNNLDVYYSAEEFGQELVSLDEEIVMITVIMPPPQETPLCSRIYLCWNKTTGEAGCFTVEYDNFFGEAWYLCGWSKEGNHLNFGTIPALPSTEDPAYAEALKTEQETVLDLMKNGGIPQVETTFGGE